MVTNSPGAAQMEFQGPVGMKTTSCSGQTVTGCWLGAKKLGDWGHGSFPHEFPHSMVAGFHEPTRTRQKCKDLLKLSHLTPSLVYFVPPGKHRDPPKFKGRGYRFQDLRKY